MTPSKFKGGRVKPMQGAVTDLDCALPTQKIRNTSMYVSGSKERCKIVKPFAWVASQPCSQFAEVTSV